MPESLPIVLVPGLNCSSRLYAPQVPDLWRLGPVSVANHTRDETMAATARRILDDAPPHFALAGLSMGGYIALEIMRQAANLKDLRLPMLLRHVYEILTYQNFATDDGLDGEACRRLRDEPALLDRLPRPRRLTRRWLELSGELAPS